MKTAKQYQWNGYTVRLSQQSDFEAYYQAGFLQPDPEVLRLTDSKSFSYQEVKDYFFRCLDADDRYDFLILDENGSILGESVINEIDFSNKSANFRIALFHTENCGKGIGSFAIACAVSFAFEEVGLERLALEVFSFNPRAIKAYEKAGFVTQTVLHDEILEHGTRTDILQMAITKQKHRQADGAKMKY